MVIILEDATGTTLAKQPRAIKFDDEWVPDFENEDGKPIPKNSKEMLDKKVASTLSIIPFFAKM